MDKNGVITINNWQNGIGASPLNGFADIRNCEISNPSGILKIAPAPTKLTGSTLTDVPTWSTWNKLAGTNEIYFGSYTDGVDIFSIDNTNVVSNISGTSIGSGTGGGIIWKGYLIITDRTFDGRLDAMDLSNGVWTDNFTTPGELLSFPTGTVTPMIVGQDDIVYIGSGRYISSLSEVPTKTFDPTDPTTFTFNNNALDLPSEYQIDSIVELGENLMIGASLYTASIISDVYNGKIFPWNRRDTSFKFPVTLDRGGVRQVISRNGQMIFTSGLKGAHQITNGSFTEDIPVIGILDSLPVSKSGEVIPDAKAFVDGEYLFGVSTRDLGFYPAGIFGFKNGAWRFLEISTGEDGRNGDIFIGTIISKDDSQFYIGWKDGFNSTYGIDCFGLNDYRYTGYKARVDSRFYQVGTALNKKQFQKIDFRLAAPLSTGQGIRLSYRTSIDTAFNIIGTFDYATFGAISSHSTAALIADTENVQIRIELTTGANSTTTPQLIDVILQ